ncbi:uncharacterized protein BXZ73DRAFT_47129 [Epithele typhae]|uniref:uncharacterized protein n=1 Tax=Epithele typhae TaxID=378194 RepID=UPI00200830CC|nr:uncharacterized protein BXZ73DRAFT_47129 [Epithele typhae]KAH9931625.1 hypothetical protein BXZ73DRAFT_47129 [Epithele typhae]
MNKSQFYLSQCAEAASKSQMGFTLGAVLVKGGKVISSGHNHHRPHYDGAEVRTQGHRKPVSMHAEMHAIFCCTGMSPSFKTQVQGSVQRVQNPSRAQRAHSLSPPMSPLSHAATASSAESSVSPKPGKTKTERRNKSRPPVRMQHGSDGGEDSNCDGGMSTSSRGSAGCSAPRNVLAATRLKNGDRGWGARRRDPRTNGSDLYVARFTKHGTGSARPCWRCLEWCRWAGVKRIFHWDADEGKFLVLKVNSAEGEQYETHADIRLFAGLVSAVNIVRAAGG